VIVSPLGVYSACTGGIVMQASHAIWWCWWWWSRGLCLYWECGRLGVARSDLERECEGEGALSSAHELRNYAHGGGWPVWLLPAAWHASGRKMVDAMEQNRARGPLSAAVTISSPDDVSDSATTGARG
jgi:hypothetical protein